MELQEKRREETPKKRGWLTGLLYWHLLPRVLGILVVILLAAAVALGGENRALSRRQNCQAGI